MGEFLEWYPRESGRALATAEVSIGTDVDPNRDLGKGSKVGVGEQVRANFRHSFFLVI